jgi:predicted DNA-binding ribbon-helix-helix protein
MALHWNDGTVIPVDRKISTANFKKLNELAQAENCTVNNLISRLIKCYEKTKA